MINYIVGDIFTTKNDIIAHQVNIAGGFGSGMAGEIKRRYPEVREKYLQAYKKNLWQLGMIQPVRTNSGLIIVNMAGQGDYQKSGDETDRVFTSYQALRVCFRKLFIYMKENNLTASIPRIGAGLGRGNWEVINSIIREEFAEYENDLELDIYSLE